MRAGVKYGLFGVVAVLAVGLWLLLGLSREQAPEPVQRGPFSGSSSTALTGKGKTAPWGEDVERRIEEALASEDPEAALIELLSAPMFNPVSGMSRPYAASRALDLLGDIGAERAAQALQQILEKWERKKRLSRMSKEEYAQALEEGTLEAIREDAKLELPGEEQVRINLWLIQLRLEGLAPLEQVERISQRLDAIQASPEPGHNKWGHGGRLIQRLGTLGLPEGLEVLERLITEELKLPAKPVPKEHWLPYTEAARAIDKINDVRGIPLLERLHARCLEFPDYYSSKGISGIWWRLKLKTIPEERWPDFLYDTMVSGTQPGADNPWTGGNLIGPACIPKMRELALDKSIVPNKADWDKPGVWDIRCKAIDILKQQDPQAIDLLIAIASDSLDATPVREIATSCINHYRFRPAQAPQALHALVDIARLAKEEANPRLLREAVVGVSKFQHYELTPEDRDFIESLTTYPPSDLHIAQWAQYALKQVGRLAGP